MVGNTAAKYLNFPELAYRQRKRLFTLKPKGPPRGTGAMGTRHECLLVSCAQGRRQGLSRTWGDIGLPQRSRLPLLESTRAGGFGFPGGTGTAIPVPERPMGSRPHAHHTGDFTEQSQSSAKDVETDPFCRRGNWASRGEGPGRLQHGGGRARAQSSFPPGLRPHTPRWECSARSW